VDSLRRMPRIVSSDPGLCAENRLRRALLEDVFAAAYARDLGEPAEHLRPHVMATIVMRGILDVWEVWDLRQNGRTATTTDLGAVTELKAAYLERVLEAGLAALDTLATVE
jgi:hypothetical protein